LSQAGRGKALRWANSSAKEKVVRTDGAGRIMKKADFESVKRKSKENKSTRQRYIKTTDSKRLNQGSGPW